MSKIFTSLIKYRLITILLVPIIIVFGIISIINVPKAQNPVVSLNADIVITEFPGASSELIDETVTKVLVDEFMKLDTISKIDSTTVDSQSIIQIFYKDDKDSEGKTKIIQNIIDKTEINSFASKPYIMGLDLSTYAMFINFQHSDIDTSISEAVKFRNNIIKNNDIKAVDIYGYSQKNILIDINEETIAQDGYSITEVFSLLNTILIDEDYGYVKLGEEENLLTIKSDLEIETNLNNLDIYPGKKLNEILKSPLQVTNVYEEGLFKYNDDQVISVLVKLKENSNIISTGNEIETLLSNVENNVKTSIPINEKDVVSDTFSEFSISLIQGLIAVVLIIVVFMGKKNALIVSITIPLSLLLTLITIFLLGFTINQMTITGLIISLGILVDNAIVMNDRIQKNMDKLDEVSKDNKIDACKQAIKDTQYPLFSSVLTTIASFAPLLFLQGEARDFALHIPLSVIFTLVFSYILSLTLLPALSSYLLGPKNKDTFGLNSNRIDKFLNIVFNNKKYIIPGAFALLILAITLVTRQPMQIFPKVDNDYIYLDYYVNNPTDPNAPYLSYDEIQSELSKEDLIDYVYGSAGKSLPTFSTTVVSVSAIPENGQMYLKVPTLSGSKKENYIVDLEERLNSKLTLSVVDVKMVELSYPSKDIEIKVTGDNKTDITNASNAIFNFLNNNIDGLESITNNYDLVKPSYDINFTSDVSTYDYTEEEIISIANRYLNLSYISDGFMNIPSIKLQSEVEDITLPAKQSNVSFNISDVASVSPSLSNIKIERYGNNLSNKVSANVLATHDVTEIQSLVEDYINDCNFTNVNVVYGGESETMSTYMTPLIYAGIIAIIAVLLILFLQFRSISTVIVIQFIIPLALVGSLLLISIANQPLSFTMFLGLSSLVGIVVNDAILLMDNIVNKCKGMDILDACIVSSKKKLRPILMTSITSILGFIPLLLSGSDLFTPMAFTLIGGLTLSTLFTVLVLPSLYIMFNQKNISKKNITE